MRGVSFVLLVASGCQSGELIEGERAPDFSLRDVNVASSTYDEDVSPRDELDEVSAWYFGHST